MSEVALSMESTHQYQPQRLQCMYMSYIASTTLWGVHEVIDESKHDKSDRKQRLTLRRSKSPGLKVIPRLARPWQCHAGVRQDMRWRGRMIKERLSEKQTWHLKVVRESSLIQFEEIREDVKPEDKDEKSSIGRDKRSVQRGETLDHNRWSVKHKQSWRRVSTAAA